MGGPVIETIRPGVQFTPPAARAFRRAEAQVRAEFGRDIDVNSTYRDYNLQLSMWQAWEAYVAGRGPKPNHSKALHPDDPLAFHTKGLALDSDDWVNERIVAILAEHGFIRNRLYVKGENHHFEWIRSEDKHYNDPVPEEDDMPLTDADLKKIASAVWSHPIGENGVSGLNNAPAWKRLGWTNAITGWLKTRTGGSYKGQNISTLLAAILEGVKTAAAQQGVDTAKLQQAIDQAIAEALDDVEITLTAKPADKATRG